MSGGSTPVATATASPAGPDNITQTGTLSVDSGPAITLNSSNSVTNSGTIQVQNKSGVTGIMALGGYTGAITNSGTITINESAATTTTDSAGNLTGPFATGSDRFGIRVVGPGALAGDIVSSGAITIQGNQSAAVSIETPLAGAVTISGAVNVSGSDSFGIRTLAAVAGNVYVSGGLSASGPGAQAVSLGGDVAGGLTIGSAVTATGYHSTARSTVSNVLADQNANDIAHGGPAVSVAGSLGRGLLVSAPPPAPSTTVADVNGDGVADAGETTGAVTSFGSAPAILIGSAGRDLNLGEVGTGDSAYGVVIEGTVNGQGVRDGISAAGLQLGLPGGGAITISGGVRVAGSLTAAAYGADATALHVLKGAAATDLYNSNEIKASVIGETQSAARAVVVEAGGALPVIQNAGTISATVAGSSGQAAAITDRSGSLARLENTGTILASVVASNGSTIPVTGTAVAIDDSANTTGFALVNDQGAAVTTAPTITGAILMGSGADSLDVRAGAITGDLFFGAGANALTIASGASVTGAVTAEGGTLALSVNGALQIDSARRIDLAGLTLGSGSTLILTADPAANAATELDVSGAATIADGAKLGLRLVSMLNGQATYTIIQANELSSGSLQATLAASTPYLYDASLATEAAAGTVSLTLSRKTAAELQLPGSIANAYEPVIAAVRGDPRLSQVLLAPTTRAGFAAAYDQLLPEHSGGVFQLVQAGVEAFGRPLDDRQGLQNGGAWLEEVNVAATAQDRNALPGYKGWGFGLIGGVELPASRIGMFGATLGGFSSELRPHDSDPNAQTVANLVEAAGYWRATVGRFALNARLAADYLTATNRRIVDVAGAGAGESMTASGHWSGWGVVSRVRASYEARWNTLYLRPQLGLDYLRLSEGAYVEGGGGALDLAVERRVTAEMSGFAGVAVGAVFGDENASWGPELLLGYRDVTSTSDGTTTARFLSGGEAFTVGPNPVSGQGGVARVALRSESGWAAVSLEGGGEIRDGLSIFDAKLAAHILF